VIDFICVVIYEYEYKSQNLLRKIDQHDMP